MKKLFALLFLLAIFKPVFLDEHPEEEASEKSEECKEGEECEEDKECEEGEECEEAEATDGAPSNRYFYYPRYDYYDHGYHHHYGYYGCCDMNFYGRRACCYNRPWSACCGNNYYNDDHNHHDHDHDHHQKDLVLKTQHSHFDSNILSSSKSTVSLGY